MDQSTFIFRVVTITLAVVIVAVVIAMLIGLFHPSIDNAEIFKILGPGFMAIVGAFVGVLSSAFRPPPKP